MAKKKKFSMRPEAAEEGLFGNVWARIVSAKYGTYGEHGNEKMIVGNRTAEDPCGVIEFEPDESDQTQEQFFSCGPASKLVPSEDGEEASNEGPFLVPAEGSNATGLSKQCNMYHLLHSLEKPAKGKLKFNTSVLDDKGLDALVGLHGYFARVPAPRISSVAVEEGARERTMIICEEIDELPGKAGKKKSTKDEDEVDIDKKFPSVKKGKAKDEDEEEEEEDEVTTEAQRIVVKALEKAGDSGIKRDQLLKKVFTVVSKSDNRKEILALLKDDDFISEGPWNWDEDEETLTAIG